MIQEITPGEAESPKAFTGEPLWNAEAGFFLQAGCHLYGPTNTLTADSLQNNYLQQLRVMQYLKFDKCNWRSSFRQQLKSSKPWIPVIYIKN